MISQIYLDSKTILGTRIYFGKTRRKWKVAGLNRPPQEIDKNKPQSVVYRIYAVPVSSKSTDLHCAIIDFRFDQSFQIPMDNDEIVLICINEQHRIILALNHTESPRWTLDDA